MSETGISSVRTPSGLVTPVTISQARIVSELSEQGVMLAFDPARAVGDQFVAVEPDASVLHRTVDATIAKLDKVLARDFIEKAGYAWDAADLSTPLNALLAGTVEGGDYSGKAVVFESGLLKHTSALVIPEGARNIVWIAEGRNTRIEKRHNADAIRNNNPTNAIADASGARPKGIFFKGLEFGAQYTEHGSIANYAASCPYSGSIINLNAWDFVLEDVNIFGMGSNGRFVTGGGGRWHFTRVVGQYGLDAVGQGGIRPGWSDDWMHFEECEIWCGDDALQPVQGYLLNRGYNGLIKWVRCKGISRYARAYHVAIGGRDLQIAETSGGGDRFHAVDCVFQGAGVDVQVRVGGTTGVINEFVLENCTTLGGVPLGVSNTESDEYEDNSASLNIMVARHPGRTGPAIGKLLVYNHHAKQPGRQGITMTVKDGLGKKVLNGQVDPGGTLEYYSGQANTTPRADVTVTAEVQALSCGHILEIDSACRFDTPVAWRAKGLEADGTTARVQSPGYLALTVSGTNDIVVTVQDEASLINGGNGVIRATAQVFIVPAGTSTGPVTLKVSADFAAQPVYRSDGVTQATAGDVAGGTYGMFGFQRSGSGASGKWLVMADADMIAALTPAVKDHALIDVAGFERVRLDDFERRPAPGQDAVRLGHWVSGGQAVLDGGWDRALDTGPLHGSGPGSPPAWAAASSADAVYGVRIKDVDACLVKGRYKSTPADVSPDAAIVPISAATSALTRPSSALLVESADMSEWPNTHTLFSGAALAIGTNILYPIGYTGGNDFTATVAISSISSNTLTWTGTDRLIRVNGTTAASIHTISATTVPTTATMFMIVVVQSGAALTITSGGNIVGYDAAGTLLELGEGVVVIYDPVSAVYRIVGRNQTT